MILLTEPWCTTVMGLCGLTGFRASAPRNGINRCSLHSSNSLSSFKK